MRIALEAMAPGTEEKIMPLLHRWKAAPYPDTLDKIAACPITNYSEQDLLCFVQKAGFTDIHLELHIDAIPSLPASWEVFLGSSPHPLAPNTRSLREEQFTQQKRKLFEKLARPVIEGSQNIHTNSIVYIQARKP